MGMYTELFLTVDLVDDTPTSIISWLKSMVNGSGDVTDAPSSVAGTRFESRLLGGSYYFYGQPFMSFEFDSISKSYHLTVLTNLKNYSNEIDKLIELLTPHLDMCKGEMIGYKRYEEDSEPTILYKGQSNG